MKITETPVDWSPELANFYVGSTEWLLVSIQMGCEGIWSGWDQAEAYRPLLLTSDFFCIFI